MPVKKGTSEPTRRSTRKITMASTKRPRKTKAGAKDVEPDLPESEESAASTPEPPAPSSSRKIKSPPAEEPAVVVAGPSIRSALFEPPPQIPSDDPIPPPPPLIVANTPTCPLNVEAFLWALARAARHIAKVLPDVAAAEELIALYRDLRPSSEIQDTILAADPKGTHYASSPFPLAGPGFPFFSDSEESDSEEPPAKRPRMAISPSPERSPTPAPPSERSLINMFFDIPRPYAFSSAHEDPHILRPDVPGPTNAVQDRLSLPVGGRSSVCTRCADHKHQCSHNWTPLEFKRFAECMRPFIAAYEDAQFASFAHVRALNKSSLASAGFALTISGAERSLAVEQFNDFFVDKEGADLARDFVAHSLQGVLKTVDPKLGPVASFDDLSSAGPSSSKLAPATSTPAAKPSTPPPTFGPAPLLETPAPSSSKARHGKGIATPSSVDKGKGVDRG
ncbi:hypothetical protein R3P38DRAFT_3219398 [Favolaschia claudopus]|uniref:Uncharacterized protein n=1 Tax=Favolaschia claudopus TaxID=2862362 RepID=A0AAW0A3W0_9AGAR